MIPRTRRPFSAPKRSKPLRKTGKLGTVRVTGIESSKLREECYLRSRGFCEVRFDGCMGWTPWKSGEMAHIRSRGASGSDVAENCKWSCQHCHRIWHQYGPSGIKPVPPKPLTPSGAESTPQQE